MLPLLRSLFPSLGRRLDPLASKVHAGQAANRLRQTMSVRESPLFRALTAVRWDRAAQWMNRSEGDRWDTALNDRPMADLVDLSEEIYSMRMGMSFRIQRRLERLGIPVQVPLTDWSIEGWFHVPWFIEETALGQTLCVSHSEIPTEWDDDWRFVDIDQTLPAETRVMSGTDDTTVVRFSGPCIGILNTSYRIPPMTLKSHKSR